MWWEVLCALGCFGVVLVLSHIASCRLVKVQYHCSSLPVYGPILTLAKETRWAEVRGTLLVLFRTQESAARCPKNSTASCLWSVNLRHAKVTSGPKCRLEILVDDMRVTLIAPSVQEQSRWAAVLASFQAPVSQLHTIVRVRDVLGSLDDAERTAVRELCVMFPQADVGQVVRFLRARKGAIANAVPFLSAHLQWRKENLPISFEFVKEELEKGKYNVYGHDNTGHKLIILHARLMGPHTYVSMEVCMKAIIYAFELMCEYHLGPVETFTVIVNLSDHGVKNIDMNWAKGVAKLLQDNYPERLHMALVAPCNLTFRSVWAVSSVFFERSTAEKVRLLPSLEDLKTYVSPSELCEELGGTASHVCSIADFFPTSQPVPLSLERHPTESRSCQAAATPSSSCSSSSAILLSPSSSSLLPSSSSSSSSSCSSSSSSSSLLSPSSSSASSCSSPASAASLSSSSSSSASAVSSSSSASFSSCPSLNPLSLSLGESSTSSARPLSLSSSIDSSLCSSSSSLPSSTVSLSSTSASLPSLPSSSVSTSSSSSSVLSVTPSSCRQSFLSSPRPTNHARRRSLSVPPANNGPVSSTKSMTALLAAVAAAQANSSPVQRPRPLAWAVEPWTDDEVWDKPPGRFRKRFGSPSLSTITRPKLRPPANYAHSVG